MMFSEIILDVESMTANWVAKSIVPAKSKKIVADAGKSPAAIERASLAIKLMLGALPGLPKLVV